MYIFPCDAQTTIKKFLKIENVLLSLYRGFPITCLNDKYEM